LSVLLRFVFLIPLAWFAALVAAAIVMSVGLFGAAFFDIEAVGYVIASIVSATFFAAMISFLPALAIIVAAEIFAWRSLLFWLAAGGVIGLIGSEVAANSGSLDFVDNLLVICLASGFTGGFVYWLIAGRDSGLRAAPA
jgi:hypothetical protein